MASRAPVPMLLALATVAHAGPEDRVTAGALRNWPPEYSLDARGQPTGFAIALMDAVAAEAGIDVEYRLYDDFGTLTADVEAGRIDVIPNFGITEERSGRVLYTRPVETFDVVVWVRAASRDVDAYEDLAGRPIATVGSNVGSDLVSGDHEVVYDDARTALFDLLAGRVDGLVYPEPVLRSLAAQAGMAERVRVLDTPLLEVRRAIAVRHDAPALRDRLDKALETVVASGEYAAIYGAWYATPPPWWTARRVAQGAGALALAGVLVVLVWRLRLQRRLLDEVGARTAAEDARRRTERRLVDVMAAAPDGIFLADSEGVYLDVNPAGCALLGTPREALVGRNLRDFVAPEDFASVPLRLDAIRRGEPVVTERRMRRADGTFVPVEISGSQLHDGTLIGIVRDVTQRKKAQAELLEREQQLQQAQKLEAVGRLAGAVAHDFNNLLTVILNDADHLRSAVPDKDRDRAEEIVRASERAADLTRQLLAFGRRQVLLPAPTDPATVVADLDKMLRRVVPANVRLSVHAAVGQATILVDRGQLEQVLMNLVLNARDAVARTGGEVDVTCHTVDLDGPAAAGVGASPGRYAVIEVADTGHGMDAATLAQVFEPFFTTKALGEGTGLGLATVQGIVRQSGGWVDVRSEVGAGTTFRVGFPLCDRAPESHAPQAVSPLRQGSGRVLIVEDEPAVRALVVEILEHAGYEVVAAATGEEALGVAVGLDLAAVVSDVVMPGLDGPGLAARLWAERPDLPVLFVSGYSDRALDEALAGPHRGLLAKPFTAEGLCESVAAVIDGPPSASR